MQFIRGNEIIRCTSPTLECSIAGKNISDTDLSGRPHLVYSDMNIVFEFVFQQKDRFGKEIMEECKIAIRNEGFGSRALDPLEGFGYAIRMTEEKKPPHLVSMTQAISNEKKNLKHISYKEDRNHIAFLSNQEFSNGAISLFYEGTKELLSRHFPDGCYILPSSVHEVMLLSKPHYLYRLNEVKYLPQDINGGRNITQGEVLSDRVLEYHARERIISYAGEMTEIKMKRPKKWEKVQWADPR